MSHYANIFFEGAWAASVIQAVGSALFFLNRLLLPGLAIIPGMPSSEPTFFAMKSFGNFNMPLACAIAAVGATAGQWTNWLVGKLILRLKKQSQLRIDDDWFQRAVSWFNRYGIFLLLFCWIPLCNLFVVMAGMANARLTLVLPLMLIGELFGYGHYLF